MLRVQDLKVHFPSTRACSGASSPTSRAVDGVSLAIPAGKTLGLVGESGCGKTTVGKGILRLLDPTSGEVWFDGTDLTRLERGRCELWRKHVQIIFQDPYASLNPRMRIAGPLEEGMAALGVGGNAIRAPAGHEHASERGRALAIKYRFCPSSPAGGASGSAIARALTVEPHLIVCDEPTSALGRVGPGPDPQFAEGAAAEEGPRLPVHHAQHVGHRVPGARSGSHVSGRIVEHGTVDEVLSDPSIYARALLSAVPVIDRASRREVIRLQGDLPRSSAGCHFQPRCPVARPARAQRTERHQFVRRSPGGLCSMRTTILLPATGDIKSDTAGRWDDNARSIEPTALVICAVCACRMRGPPLCPVR